MRRTHRLGLALALLLLAPMIVTAQPPAATDEVFTAGGPGAAFGDRARVRHGHGLRGFLPPPGYLDLSDEQIEAVHELLQSMHAELEPLREQRRGLHEQLEAVLEADDPDAATVGQLVIDGKDLREQKHAVFESYTARFEALLTSEQLEKWEHFREIREERREQRRSRRHRGRS